MATLSEISTMIDEVSTSVDAVVASVGEVDEGLDAVAAAIADLKAGQVGQADIDALSAKVEALKGKSAEAVSKAAAIAVETEGLKA